MWKFHNKTSAREIQQNLLEVLVFRKSQSYDNLHVFLLRLKQLCQLTTMHEPQQMHLYSPATTETTLNFTFSEPYIAIQLCEKDQLDAHLFLITHFNSIILDMFRTNNCPSSGGILYAQLTAFHHASYEEFICWHDTIRRCFTYLLTYLLHGAESFFRS